MKYCEKKQVYGDISEISKSIVSKIKEKVNKTDSFYWGWIENMPKGKVWVRPKGQKVITTDCGSHLWQRIQIESYDEKIDSKELLKKLLAESGLKKFHDEDGQNGIFQKKGMTKYQGYEDESYCYVNPFFEDGYWENHTLETEFIG